MDIQQIPQADLLDSLFDGRNKDYGAYDLRKSYNNRLSRAMLTTLAVCLLLFIGYTVAGRSHPRPSLTYTHEVDLSPVDLTPKKKDAPVVIPKPAHQPAPRQKPRTMTAASLQKLRSKPAQKAVPPPGSDSC